MILTISDFIQKFELTLGIHYDGLTKHHRFVHYWHKNTEAGVMISQLFVQHEALREAGDKSGEEILSNSRGGFVFLKRNKR